MIRRDIRARGPLMVGSVAVMAGVLSAAAGVASADDGPVPMSRGCTPLVVLGVQGTTQSAPTADPHANTGVLGSVFAPLAGDSADVQQILIPYDASFGGLIGTGPDTTPFAQSVQHAGNRLEATAAEVAAQCPTSRLAVIGYSQGAGATNQFAHKIGANQGPVPPDRIAGVIELSDWKRPTGPQTFPGRPGQNSPDPVPGTAGAATSQVHLPPVPNSGGVAAGATDFGKLNGRVGELCATGDPSCDAPQHAAAATVVAGIAGQTDFRDPLTAIATAGAAWSSAVSATETRVLLNDVHVQGNRVDYAPKHSVSDRLAHAAVSPDMPPTPQQTQAAAAVARQVVAAVAADPIGQLPHLAQEIVGAIGANLADNSALIDPATLLHYAPAIARHDSYAAPSPATQWLAAMARDQSGRRPR